MRIETPVRHSRRHRSPGRASPWRKLALAAAASAACGIAAAADTQHGIAVHGFADVGAGWSSAGDPAPLRGFNGGLLDLYLTPQFGPRVKGLIEIALEYGDDGGLAVDMERLQLGYLVSDALTLWAGRFHTPFGLWNTAFHHGANLQTSISRPRFIDFEDKGGIVPAHSVGTWGSGKTALGTGKLAYDVFIANGPRIAARTLDFNASTDNSPGKMVGGNVGYLPGGALRGLTLGAHAFGSTVNAYNSGNTVMSSTKLRMSGVYFGYDENDWEAIGEYYHFGNSDARSGAKHSSNASFVQVGKTLGALTPFARIESVSLDTSDNYFSSQLAGRPYTRYALGARYEIDSVSSVKIELGQTKENSTVLIDDNGVAAPFAARSYRRAALQFSVAF